MKGLFYWMSVLYLIEASSNDTPVWDNLHFLNILNMNNDDRLAGGSGLRAF